MISLLITSVIVSVDSFVCGFSFSDITKKRQCFWVVFLISLIVYVMSLTVNNFAIYFTRYLNEKTASLGGGILIVSGMISLLKQIFSKDLPNIGGLDRLIARPSSDYKYRAITTGFAVGLDGASANLSMAIMGMNAFYVPLTIGLTHAVAVYLGLKLSQTKLVKKVTQYDYVPPTILMLIGIIKIKDFFF